MRILIVSYYFPPFMNVGGFRAASWAEEWRKAGHEISVLTSDGSERGFCEFFHTEGVQGVRILPVRNPIQEMVNEEYEKAAASRPGFKQRLKKYLPILDSSVLWAKEAEKRIRKETARTGAFDVIVSTAFPASDHLVAWRLSRRLGAEWVADFRDWYGEIDGDEPERAWTRRLWLKRLFRRWSKDMSFATTVSPGLAEFLADDFPHCRIEVIYNGYFEENYPTEWRNDSGPGAYEVLYTGSWGDDPEPLVPLFEAFRLLRARGVEPPPLRFTGKENQRLRAALPRDVSVEFIGTFSNREIAVRQRQAGFLLLAPLRGIGILHTKTFEYLAVGRPILVLADEESELRNAVFGKDRRAYSLNRDPAKIADFIVAWRNRATDREDLYSESEIGTFSREAQADRLLALISRAVSLHAKAGGGDMVARPDSGLGQA